MYKVANSGWLKHFDFMVVDILLLEVAFIIAYKIRFGVSSPIETINYSILAVILPILHIFIVFFTEEYSGILRRGYLKEFKAILQHNLILAALVIFYMFATQQSEYYSRSVFFIIFGINIVFSWISRAFVKKALLFTYSNEKNRKYMLVVASTKAEVEKTTQQLQAGKYNNYAVRGLVIVDVDMEGDTIKGVPVVANEDTLYEYLRTNTVDGVFIQIHNSHYDIEVLTAKLLKMGVTVHISLAHLSSEMPNKVVEEINGFTVLTTSIKMATNRQLVIKRMIDISGGLFGLFATIIAFVVFAPIIYIQSPGPIFFSQERVGRNGRRFQIYKFRSMYMDAEECKKELMVHNKMDGLMFKMDNDPRIMPIGKFIRRVSIDELPQSINILRGDMSLVGTRPPTVDEYDKYKLHHKRRLAAKPGLTGMWQVSGRSDITDFEEIVKLDTEYIQNFSLSLYLKILFKTVGVVLRKKGSI
ncbi:exopolysaccharide biosynthesis polyprenyl glycosylphosphotransferase [Carnobacterium alterfunditum]|uniref:Exopolysaccharide biosynthesis polyprenyl glycosylphosphotransferase n=1 Tax=Carnobacterium alterfunditum TaxID=28230 RepID=A0A1N6HID4_9LACT|nr:sugar transferase [Carnobacterium alterfunditum]SIO19496.1 exopolysaccharide biosynthesis polyprenyl glycosylphosphotransferase [Carnobacterium alterfunditum]